MLHGKCCQDFQLPETNLIMPAQGTNIYYQLEEGEEAIKMVEVLNKEQKRIYDTIMERIYSDNIVKC